uniref:F-box domain-containing protein n=1 Tax=Mycena chlorophos TaxID=658473 RepID=A0ABQ0KUX7_MYCCL|nr:predicted protein [Mycena chlorophos]
MTITLPVEILQAIIETMWHMPLTSSERTTLITSSALVNSIWADIFDLVSSRNVYLTSPVLAERFLEQIRAPPQPTPKKKISASFLRRWFRPQKTHRLPKRRPNLACQTLTIGIYNPNVHPHHKMLPHLPMGFVFDDLLEHIDAHSLLPNLRALAVEYVDAPFEDPFTRTSFASLPDHVKTLGLRWSYSPGMPSWLAEALKEKQGPQKGISWGTGSIERVVVEGAGENVVKDLRTVFPNANVECM